MKESEAKYLIVDPGKIGLIKQILEEENYRHLSTVEEIDTYYNHPCRDFAETDEALRVRVRRTTNGVEARVLTYKGPRKILGDVKIREEYEVFINNDELMKKILLSLGFHEVGIVRKVRTIYRSPNNCEALIDYLEDTKQYYLEIECSINEISKISEKIKNFVKPVHETYLEIILRRMGRK